MEQHIGFRRHAAQERIRRGLTDPLFNLREVVKQMTLLEDHLAHPYKVCQDCIRKHLITIEALAEEASAMDDRKDIVPFEYEKLAELARAWMENIEDGEDLKVIAGMVRSLRKALMPTVCDPRESASRVAAMHQERGSGICPHM
jgi:hypothetical protein